MGVPSLEFLLTLINTWQTSQCLLSKKALNSETVDHRKAQQEVGLATLEMAPVEQIHSTISSEKKETVNPQR